MKKNLYDELNKRVKKIEEMLNGGPGSGNFGHAGRPGEIGGSASASGAVRDLGKGIVDRTRETGGFTVSAKGEFLELGKTDGYAVGGQSNEASCSVKDWNDSTKRNKFLRQYIEQNAVKLMPKTGNYLGGWVDNGRVYLDVSRVIKSEKEATIHAMKTDQDAITDFKKGEFPATKDLVKKYGLEKEYAKYKGIRAKERKESKKKDDDILKDIPF